MEKATLTLEKDENGQKIEVVAQFNPQSLRISYFSRGQQPSTASGDSGAAGSKTGQTNQRTDYGITMSSLELFFDTTQTNEDVRNKYTLVIANKMMKLDKQTVAPTIRFHWGTFIFKGTINSMNETIDYFSEQGVPLRATVSLSMSMVEERKKDPAGIGANASASASAGFSASASANVSAGVSASAGISASASFSGSAAVGTTPLTLAASGESIQSISGRAGLDWKATASANNIDNPRQLQAGAVLNLSASARTE